MHLDGDGKVQAARPGERQHGTSRAYAFGHHAEIGQPTSECPPARDRFAQIAIAAVSTRGGRDEVTEAREPCECFGARAERDTEPRHLGEATCQERTLRIVAESET